MYEDKYGNDFRYLEQQVRTHGPFAEVSGHEIPTITNWEDKPVSVKLKSLPTVHVRPRTRYEKTLAGGLISCKINKPHNKPAYVEHD